MKVLRNLSLILLFFSLGFSACKKEQHPGPFTPLYGQWEEKGLNGASRTLRFGDDYSFVFRVSPKSGDGIVTSLIGTYAIEGNNLKIKLSQKLVQETNKAEQRSAYSGELYTDATFRVTNSLLTLNYTSYPADAPVATVAEFDKLITID